MKTTFMVLTVLVIGIAAFGFVGDAYAQDTTPLYPGNGGNGRRGAEGTGTGIPLEMNINLDGALEDILHAYMAEALEIDPSVLADGNFTEIALGLGYELTEIREIVMQAHSDALAQALVDRLITQEVYDWLSVRGFITIADGKSSGMEVGIGSGMGTGTGTCLVDGTPLLDGTSQNSGFRGGRK